MMIQGITSSDLVSAYIERYHSSKTILAIYLNNSEGCRKVLSDIESTLMLPIPHRIRSTSDILFIESRREELENFLVKHNQLVCDTYMELYVHSSLHRHN